MIARRNNRRNNVGAYLDVRPFDSARDVAGLNALFSRPADHEWSPDLSRRVAVDQGGHVVGHVSWGGVSPQVAQSLDGETDAHLLEIQQIHVADSHRRLGLGRRLLADAVDAVLQSGCEPVLACEMDNGPALVLYHGEGFVIRGRFIVAQVGGIYSMLRGNASWHQTLGRALR